MSTREPYPNDATGEEWVLACSLLRLLVGRP
jgi:hypothetical protein